MVEQALLPGGGGVAVTLGTIALTMPMFVVPLLNVLGM